MEVEIVLYFYALGNDRSLHAGQIYWRCQSDPGLPKGPGKFYALHLRDAKKGYEDGFAALHSNSQRIRLLDRKSVV